MNRLNAFAEYLRENDKSENTIGSYTSDLEQFFSFLDDDMENVTKNDITAYKERMQEQGRSIKTINRKLVSLKQYIEFINDEFDAGITIKIKPEKQQRQDYLDEMLDKKDFAKLVKAAVDNNDIRAKALFYTLLQTGGRISEVLQLSLDDLNIEYITVKGKGSKYRDLFIPVRLRTIWAEYAKVRVKKSDKLFTGQRGAITPATVHNIVKKYAKIAGVELSKAHCHNFRHLFCKMLADNGYPIETIADMAGHSDINTTRIYTRKTRKELAAAADDFADAINV